MQSISRILGYFIPFLFIAGVIISCNEEEVCDQKVRSMLYATFKKVKDGEEIDTTLNNLSLRGLGMDSLIYNNVNNLNQIELSLNPEDHTSTFIITLDSIYDTIHLFYQHELIFVSYPCGFTTYYTIDSAKYTTNKIDSLILTNPIIDPESEETYKIFL